MYELHAWFGLAETASEGDVGGLGSAVDALQPILARFVPPQAIAEVRSLNGDYFLWVNGMQNRPRDLEGAIEDLLGALAERLPGSWGIVYDRSDEWFDRSLANAFRVRVLARGNVSVREDTFLSPVRPTIED